MTGRALLLLLPLIATRSVVAQLKDANPETQAACSGAFKTQLPPEAVQQAVRKAWPTCSSYKLYSGVGSSADFSAARKCAWKERSASEAGLEPRYTAASVFGGSAMLTMLYANGQGVERNYALAIRFACEAGGAPAEINLRIQHLKKMRSEPSETGAKFNFCDDITSGFMEGFCASYASEIEGQKRDARLRRIIGEFTPDQKTAFGILNKAQEAYGKAHAQGEIDLSGTARAMYQIDAEETLRENFIAALEAFETGRVPAGGSAEEFRTADAKLNSAYRVKVSDAEQHKSEYGAVQPEGIQEAERAWLKYREAWIQFAKFRYPGVSSEAWLTLLSNDRTSVLDGSLCDMDNTEGPCSQGDDTWKPSPLP